MCVYIYISIYIYIYVYITVIIYILFVIYNLNKSEKCVDCRFIQKKYKKNKLYL